VSFSVEWLSLREPHDIAARNSTVMNAALGAFRKRSSLRITDLGCGTGSTLRTLAPRLAPKQAWRLVDYDDALLARAAESSLALHMPVQTERADLSRELEDVLQKPADLITNSALLDLVSEEWIDRLVTCAAKHLLSVYAALNYDGRIALSPAHPLDDAIVQAVNLHQRGDKGFGPALGPAAADAVISKFVQRGFAVVQGRADWVASENDRAFQSAIIEGWAQAAGEIGSAAAHDLDAWLSFRQSEIAGGRSRLRVGHVDFFATPPAR
jgi:SAM-dependent methyltransferase